MDAKCKESSDNLLRRLEREILPRLKQVISERNATSSNHAVAGYGHTPGCQSVDCPASIEEIEEHFHSMILLLNKQKDDLLDKQHEIDTLNRDLAQALERITEKDKDIHTANLVDRLTGLFNRHHLETVLEEELERCHRYNHPLAIMMIDIDRFKSFNKEFGHNAGDRVLAFLGKLINKNVRKFDRSFRYGEEEFVVVLPQTDLMLAYFVAERIRKHFQNKLFKVNMKSDASEQKVSRTVSIGISSTFNYSANNISIEDLLNQTENALIQAKEKGGNKCIRYV
jgi:diguanylate cyclase (GGDEF)-like protein